MDGALRLQLIIQLILIASGLKIIPEDPELMVTSGDNLTLTCKHDGPVRWIHPNYDHEPDGSKLFQENVVKENETYVSNLTINRANYLDTGYYVCVSQNGDKRSEIYIYVYDEENLLAVNESFVILSQNEFGDVVIPCKPTFPDVNVTLTNESDEPMKNLIYDPKKGFIMRSPKVTDSGSVMCTATRGSVTKSQQFLITVHPMKTEVARPVINANGDYGPRIEGSTVLLNCSIFEELGVTLFLSWILPNELTTQSGRATMSQQFAVPFRGTSMQNYRILTIKNVTRHDQGIYICKVEDRNNNEANVTFELITTEKDKTFLNMSLQGRPEITVRSGISKVQWIVNVVGNPEPKIVWNDPGDREIVNSAQSNKYSTIYTKSVAKLVIQNLTIWDSGVYTIHAYNDGHRNSLNMTLLVEGKPSVKLHNTQLYYSSNLTYSVECTVTGLPLPIISWYSKTCNQYPNCEENVFKKINNGYSEISKHLHQVMSVYEFKSIDTSILMCEAINTFGTANESSAFFVTDFRDGLELQAPKVVASGDDLSLICGVSLYCYDDDIIWYHRNFDKTQQIRLNNSVEHTIVSNKTKFSHRSVLTIRNVNENWNGEFTCEAHITNNMTVNNSTTYQLYIHGVQAPMLIPSGDDNKTTSGITEVSTGKQMKFRCYVKGIPLPSIVWKKDGVPIYPPDDTSSSRVVLVKEEDDPLIIKETLKIRYAALNDDGIYTCFASNRIGNVSLSRVLSLTDKGHEHAHTMFFLVSGVLVLAFVFCAVTLYIKCRKDKKLKKELAETGLLNFEEGAVSSLNPELGVEDQADLLPYDRRFEFPRDKLKLGKQLGSGAFGVVMKAEADGIIDENITTTVAVKMVKRGADSLYIKALASELKIMIHLGRHLNVVNLLGACTRDIHKRELIVIVEYCRYGNLHDFLMKQRSNFINQINEKTGRLDPTIDTLNNMMDYDDPPLIGNGRTTTTSIEETPIGSDGYLLNKDSEPDWRSNYRGDYRNTFVKPISTTDLICWSFQVARGMDYLASRKVLHGDLAARNVLLADDNIVKICDFGLAKSMYNSENYQRRKNELLPVRWMAIESIRDRVFSTQSDVWSFGITLWELFSLSVTPYPGIEHLEVLYSKLVAGHRMERPMFATSDLYDIMLDCWRSRPNQRPTFTELTERLGNMLEDGVRSHYTKLNEMYLRMNTEMNNSVDYLALMNPPVYSGFDTEPRYVNIPLNDNNNADPEDDVELKPMLNNNSGKPVCFMNPGYTDMSRRRMEPIYANTPLTPTQV